MDLALHLWIILDTMPKVLILSERPIGGQMPYDPKTNITHLDGTHKDACSSMGYRHLEVYGDVAEMLRGDLEAGANGQPHPNMTTEQIIGAQAVISDYEAILKYLGAANREGLTSYHVRKWIDAWLSFCAEGRAPTLELNETFQSFKKWARQEKWPTTTITDEVRALFNRMLGVEYESSHINSEGVRQETKSNDHEIAVKKYISQFEGMGKLFRTIFIKPFIGDFICNDLPFQLLGIVSLLVLIAIFPMPYGYYTFIKILVCLLSAYVAFQGYRECQKGIWPWAWASIAIIFNPIIQVELDEELWMSVDILVGTFFAVASYKVFSQRHGSKEEAYLVAVERAIAQSGCADRMLEAQGSDREFCIEIMKFHTAAYKDGISAAGTANLSIDALNKHRELREYGIEFTKALRKQLEKGDC
ncbi:MAG: hypothetical protein DI586_04280 [Micavibrio aeruginosavorus]|uniref:Uncharacterized protein n=1 Tax=Micavibrio aeruginosavorus TaxID=349221 RepID=A0A2W5FMJ8_9BACT|nr:MAG: hypothetical protein DI586_04280 [Micavibrio aeruginosavorus]